MARQARLAVAGEAHYLVQRAVHGQALVEDEVDLQALRAALAEAVAAGGLQLWAAAVTRDALHLLLTPPQPAALGRMMQSLGRRYVAGFNRRHGRQGALFAARFATALVQEGECLLSVMLLIDGLSDAGAWWSSGAHHLGREVQPMLQDPPALWALGNTPFEREGRYRERLALGLAPAFKERVAAAVRGGHVVGEAAYVARMAESVGRPLGPRRRGRPPGRGNPPPSEGG